jgi:hypothetical protein
VHLEASLPNVRSFTDTPSIESGDGHSNDRNDFVVFAPGEVENPYSAAFHRALGGYISR